MIRITIDPIKRLDISRLSIPIQICVQRANVIIMRKYAAMLKNSPYGTAEALRIAPENEIISP